MRHGSLFSGIGGFDLAAEWIGWENVFHCEINEFCQKVLKYHFPKSIGYADIKTTDFTIWRGKIDIITGGFPCQPFSAAGKRKGTEDDRHLWPEMLRAIGEIQPSWVVGENVHGIVNWSKGMVFEQVQADLENEGYHTQAYILPACAKDAPHRRDRVWFIAHAKSSGQLRKVELENNQTHCRERRGFDFDEICEISQQNEYGNAANADSNGQHRSDSEHEKFTSERREYAFNDVEQIFDAADTSHKRLQRSEINGSIAGIGENGNEQFTGLLQST